MSWNTISHLLLWIVVIIQFGLLFILTRLVVQFLTRFRTAGLKVEEIGLRAGTSAPLFRAKDNKGNLIKLHEYIGEQVLLIFSSPTCPTCESLLFKISSLPVSIMIISSEKYPTQNILKYSQYNFIHAPDILENYYIQKVPTWVLVDKNGEIQYTGDHTEVDEIVTKLSSLSQVGVHTVR